MAWHVNRAWEFDFGPYKLEFENQRWPYSWPWRAVKKSVGYASMENIPLEGGCETQKPDRQREKIAAPVVITKSNSFIAL